MGWFESLAEDFLNIYFLSLKKEATIVECWNEAQSDCNLGLRRGQFDRELDSWLGLVSRLDTVRFGEETDISLQSQP